MEDKVISLMQMTKDFIEKTVPDRRRTAVDAYKININVDLAYKLIIDYTYNWFDITDVENVMLFLRRKEDPITTTDIGFFYRINEDGILGGTSEIARLPILYYFAATYEHYNMETIELHIDELKNYDNSNIKIDVYIDCIEKYNKKLPDDVKLWFSLR